LSQLNDHSLPYKLLDHSSSETALQTRDLEREHGEFGESGDTSWITIAETFVHTDKPGNQQDSEDLLPQYSFNDTLESENSKRHNDTKRYYLRTTQEQPFDLIL